jgi:Domain of unknown function (DUF4145)
MADKFVDPGFERNPFTCLHCDVVATMEWQKLFIPRFGAVSPTRWWSCACNHCHGESIWLEGQHKSGGKLAYPITVVAPATHPDLPEICREDFDEARLICSASSRGAAALLRLCLQKLLGCIGGKGEHIDTDIKALVASGLDPHIQQALDVIRVTGNNAVHPLDMAPEDVRENVPVLFEMINLIVDEKISRPKRIEERFARLPEKARLAIEKRDRPKNQGE